MMIAVILGIIAINMTTFFFSETSLFMLIA